MVKNVTSLIAVIVIILTSSALLGQSLKKAPVYTEEIPGSNRVFSMKLITSPSFQTKKGQYVKMDDFYIGTHEVTHDLFALYKRKDNDTKASNLNDKYAPDAVTRPTPPYTDMSFGMGDVGGYPAVSLTQQATLHFCYWLYLKTGRFYRLPTEAEWTAVALMVEKEQERGEKGWFEENSDSKFHKVGQLRESSGIYDLFGNVLEWTLDSWEDEFLMNTGGKNISNPWNVPTKKHYRVLKGGSYYDDAEEVTAYTRYKSERKWQERDPQIPKSKWWLTDGEFVGFRLVSPVQQPSRKEIETFFEKAIVD